MVDVTVVHPILGAHETGTRRSLDVDCILKKTELKKIEKYADLVKSGGWKFTPLAVTSYGRWGKATHQLLSWLREELLKRKGEEKFRILAPRWNRLLSCSLVKGNSTLLARRGARAIVAEARRPHRPVVRLV
eukprot:Filipodium_phascolosomae@DN2224_c0_g1_i2.p1